MHIDKLKIAHFKNHNASEFKFSAGVNCLYGANGVGKTNILDAVYFLGNGRSYFSRNDQQSIPFESEFARWEGVFIHKGESNNHTVVLREAGKKSIERNGSILNRLSDLVSFVPIVMITPGDISIVTGSSEERRRLIDRTLSMFDATYLKSLQRHNKLLLMRNELLKKFARERHVDGLALEAIDVQMEKEVNLIFDKRTNFVQELDTEVSTLYEIISGKKEWATSIYKSELQGTDWHSLQKKSLKDDLFSHRTGKGLHRDDVVLALNGREVKKYASQGQIKTLTIALNLATYRLLEAHAGMIPILLLDDIYEKIDEARAGRLMELITSADYGQIFITDTSEERMKNRLSGLKGVKKFFNIESA